MLKEKVEKEKVMLDLQEVRAYRELQDEAFDFGTGIIKPENTYSEDEVLSLKEQELLDQIDDTESSIERKSFSNPISRYVKNKKSQKKLENKLKENPYFIYQKENEDTGELFIAHNYLSGKKKFAKKMTNRRVRKSNCDFSNPSSYRKLFDYEFTLF